MTAEHTAASPAAADAKAGAGAAAAASGIMPDAGACVCRMVMELCCAPPQLPPLESRQVLLANQSAALLPPEGEYCIVTVLSYAGRGSGVNHLMPPPEDAAEDERGFSAGRRHVERFYELMVQTDFCGTDGPDAARAAERAAILDLLCRCGAAHDFLKALDPRLSCLYADSISFDAAESPDRALRLRRTLTVHLGIVSGHTVCQPYISAPRLYLHPADRPARRN